MRFPVKDSSREFPHRCRGDTASNGPQVEHGIPPTRASVIAKPELVCDAHVKRPGIYATFIFASLEPRIRGLHFAFKILSVTLQEMSADGPLIGDEFSRRHAALLLQVADSPRKQPPRVV